MGNLIKKLKGMLPRYHYRDLTWVTRIGQPITFPDKKVIAVDNFYSETGFAYTGVCNELMVQAYLDIYREVEEPLHMTGRIYRVKGRDNQYFRLPPAEIYDTEGNITKTLSKKIRVAHYFLAFTDKRIAEEGSCLKGEEAREALLDGNALIFDPSFHTLEKLADSLYTISEVWASGYAREHKIRAELFWEPKEGDQFTPTSVIGISGRTIVTLKVFCPDIESPNDITTAINLIEPGSEPLQGIPVYSNSLDHFAQQIEGFDLFLSHMRKVCRNAVNGSDFGMYNRIIKVC